jgi:hypothetical protein
MAPYTQFSFIPNCCISLHNFFMDELASSSEIFQVTEQSKHMAQECSRIQLRTLFEQITEFHFPSMVEIFRFQSLALKPSSDLRTKYQF